MYESQSSWIWKEKHTGLHTKLGNIETEASYKFMTEEERLRGAQEAAMKRWGEVAKVAARVASDSFSFATGNTITIDGGSVMS